MLNIQSCIRERMEYTPVPPSRKDKLAEQISHSEPQKEVFLIVPDRTLPELEQEAESGMILGGKYYIAGLFDLGTPFCNLHTGFVLIQAAKHECSEVKTAKYHGQTYDHERYEKPHRSDHFELPEEYTPDYARYLQELENWVNNGIQPETDNGGLYETTAIASDELDPNNLDPDFYTEKALEIKELARKESFVKLSEVADILVPRPLRREEEPAAAKVLTPDDFSYPLHVDSLKKRRATDVILQQGDIIVNLDLNQQDRNLTPYLFDADSQEPVCAQAFTAAVIRCRDLPPEYLFFYLSSDIVNSYLRMIQHKATHMLSKAEYLGDIPVTMPCLEPERYRRDFEILYPRTEEKNYENYRQCSMSDSGGRDDRARPEHFEDVINIEFADRIKAYDEEWLRSFLSGDLKELNTCYADGAYKAALILAGSILEAVLIDWLSENDGENYFEKEYTPLDERDNKKGQARHNNRKGYSKRDDLCTFINDIRTLQQPDWKEEADKAHEIRKKRNLVHARLCKESDEINQEICRQTIIDLWDVLKTRGITGPENE